MSQNDLNRERFLVREVRDNNEEAFRQLFDLYRDDIYTYGLSLLKRKEYAEEILQDTFLKVWMHRTQLDPGQSFRSYVFTISRNLTLNFLRKAANDRKLRNELFSMKVKVFNPIEEIMQEKELERIKTEAINLLPPRRRRIFEMSRFEGKSYEDISRELDISLSTVKNQMSKALETIRDFLQVHGDISWSVLLLAWEIL
ncbi:RNA polymerase sigma factor [Membranihabitans maritimus]|uniref:RNA polymerase sigma factor n=1 Tax=Membranihabitans maritimus TaxID=2904244 RepID=UPI001F285025|nr:RNA polymerase sigma-70 factor [Membranihabitans maritimus]